LLASSRQTIRLFYTYHTYSSRQSIQRNGSVKPQLNSFMENLDGKRESEFTRKASVCVTRICPNAAFSYPFKDTESNGPLHRMGLSELQHRFSSWNVQKRWRNHTANEKKFPALITRGTRGRPQGHRTDRRGQQKLCERFECGGFPAYGRSQNAN